MFSGKASLEVLDFGDIYWVVWCGGLVLTLGYALLAWSAGRVGQRAFVGDAQDDATKPGGAGRASGF